MPFHKVMDKSAPTQPNPDNFVLCTYPHKLTTGDVKALLAQNAKAAKKRIVEFIYHRLYRRFIMPLRQIHRDYQSGFLMMASACLLIETLQSFYSGQNKTRRRESTKTFRTFFEREVAFFPGFAAESDSFYVNIRCGILHQAETTGGYRILRSGPLFIPATKTINASAFIKALEECLDDYIRRLHAAEMHDPLWHHAAEKIIFICKNCQVEPATV